MKCILLLILILPSLVFAQPKIELLMFNTFHGDIMLLTLPDNTTMAIDVGQKDKARKFLFPVLEKRKIKKLDYLVLTHTDRDHLGSAAEVINTYEVGQIWHNGRTTNTKQFKDYIKASDIKKIPRIEMRAYQIFFIGEVKFTVFNPPELRTETVANNMSVVFKIEWKNFSMLFVGDLEKKGQTLVYNKYAGELQSRVYKVGHHGSKSYRPFLEAVNPEHSICPCLGIPFIAPALSTKRPLKKMGKWHSVKRMGNIQMITDGDTIDVRKYRGD